MSSDDARRDAPTIRDTIADDFDQLVRLNAEWVHFTSELDLPALERLHRLSAYHRVVEAGDRIVAFLLALREGVDYASPNYRYFSEHGGRFLYIDRIVVCSSAQGKGVARMLYDDVLAFASESGVTRVVCELDVEPPNEASERFHDTYGFREVGTQEVGGGAKRVSLRELVIGQDA